MFGVRVLSRRVGYKVDRTQEMYALGGTLLFSGFFPVYAANNGLGASSLLQGLGGTTQVGFCDFYIKLFGGMNEIKAFKDKCVFGVI